MSWEKVVSIHTAPTAGQTLLEKLLLTLLLCTVMCIAAAEHMKRRMEHA